MQKKIIRLTSILFVFTLTMSVMVIINNNYQPRILGKLKLRYVSSNNYNLLYGNTKIAARVTAVDGWYIEKPYVYGSTTVTSSNSGNDVIYFLVNVCNGNSLQTKYRSEFNSILDSKNISKKNRYFMSGMNAIDIKEPEYSAKIDCSEYK